MVILHWLVILPQPPKPPCNPAIKELTLSIARTPEIPHPRTQAMVQSDQLVPKFKILNITHGPVCGSLFEPDFPTFIIHT